MFVVKSIEFIILLNYIFNGGSILYNDCYFDVNSLVVFIPSITVLVVFNILDNRKGSNFS